MPSVIQQRIAEREKLMKHTRRLYLRTVGLELGFSSAAPADIADLALREAGAMIALAQELLAERHRLAKAAGK